MKKIILLFLCFSIKVSIKSQCPTSVSYPASVINVICDDTIPYKLVFHDEFNGNSIDTSQWHTYFPYGAGQTDNCDFCRTELIDAIRNSTAQYRTI